MKKLILLFCLVCFFTISYSQVKSSVFKNTQRQISTTKKSFTPIIINGSKNKASKKATNLSQQNTSYLNSLSIQECTEKVKYSNTTKLPIFIEKQRPMKKSFSSNKARCYDFLESIKSETKINNPSKDFIITSEETDKLGQTHIRMSQKFKGIDVYGSDFYVHLKNEKEQFIGNYQLITNVTDTVAKISEKEALNKVMSDLPARTIVKQLSDQQKKDLDYDKPQIKLVLRDIEEKINSYKLMYQISIRPNFFQEWIYLIDAENGAIYRCYDNNKYDGPVTANAYDLHGVLRNINTYLKAGTYYLKNGEESMYNSINDEGYIITSDFQNAQDEAHEVTSMNNNWNNPAAVSVQYYSTLTYRYLYNTFSRNSINDKGGNIQAYVNLSDKDGSGFDNAFWSGGLIFFGNGGSQFANLAGGLDVVAHEIGHGVVENTAKLKYENQSGAINETFADIFGAMVDREDWYIGEDITKTSSFPTGRMRDMSNPHNSGVFEDSYWQPSHLSEMYIGEDDNGGVHINSGIGNYAFYLFASSLTKEKAEQVFYRALVTYLTSSAQFIDLRIAIIQSTIDLYGEASIEVAKAKEAFDAVGIFENTGNDYSQNFDTNPGELKMCYYDLDANHPYTFYSSSIIGENPIGITNYYANSRISFTDDGTIGYYVSSSGTIRAIIMGDQNDIEMQGDAIWSNVAISKDGKRLAAVTTETDTSIWVYDFTSSIWAKFQLYNPTTSDNNQKADGVLFSDAIEFDITGEYIIYDAFNGINMSSGTDLNYWDIGFISVWDNNSNVFGSGDIVKLIGSLPEKISIGNPTFSKNSPYIIAFDYFNESASEFDIVGLNILTGEADIIATNSTLGFPSYSKGDNMLIFTSMNGENNAIKGLDLMSNKISANSIPFLLIDQAKFGVCYATGTRVLGLAPIANFSSSYRKGKTPLTIQFFDNTVNDPISWQWTFEGGNPSTSIEQNPIITYSTEGNYNVSLKAINTYGNNYLEKTTYIEIIQSVLSVSANFLTIASTANSEATFDISSNIEWTAESSQDWLTISSIEGSNNSTITLTATENLMATSRNAIVTISGSGVPTKTITIIQDGSTTGFIISTSKEFEIYPNPVKDFFYIQANLLLTNDIEINIYSVDGQLIKSSGYKENIDVSEMQNGIYILKIITKSISYQFKIVKE